MLVDTDAIALEPFRRASAALSVWFNRPKLYAPPDSDIVLKARKELNNRNSAMRRAPHTDQKKTVAGSNVDIHRRRVETEVKVCPRIGRASSCHSGPVLRSTDIWWTTQNCNAEFGCREIAV